MKSTDVKTSTYIKYGVEHNGKEHKSKLAIMKEYKNIFGKGYAQTCSEEVCFCH